MSFGSAVNQAGVLPFARSDWMMEETAGALV